MWVALDDGAGLIAVQLRHQDVAEDELWLKVIHFRQRVKAIFGQQHFVAALFEKNFSTTSNGVAVIYHQHFEKCFGCTQFEPPLGL